MIGTGLRGRRGDPCDPLSLGGGPPSLLPVSDIRRIVRTFSDLGWLVPGCRVFLEANPEDVSEASLAGFREAGVSTLSLGVQSLDPESLRFLGRGPTRDPT